MAAPKKHSVEQIIAKLREVNRTGIVGGSRLWKQGWSHGKEQPTKKPAGEALLT